MIFRRIFLPAGVLWLLAMAGIANAAGASALSGHSRGKASSTVPYDPLQRVLGPQKPEGVRQPDRRFLPPPAAVPPPGPTADFGRRHLAPYPVGERVRFCLRSGGTLYCYDDPYPRHRNGTDRSD